MSCEIYTVGVQGSALRAQWRTQRAPRDTWVHFSSQSPRLLCLYISSTAMLLLLREKRPL